MKTTCITPSLQSPHLLVAIGNLEWFYMVFFMCVARIKTCLYKCEEAAFYILFCIYLYIYLSNSLSHIYIWPFFKHSLIEQALSSKTVWAVGDLLRKDVKLCTLNLPIRSQSLPHCLCPYRNYVCPRSWACPITVHGSYQTGTVMPNTFFLWDRWIHVINVYTARHGREGGYRFHPKSYALSDSQSWSGSAGFCTYWLYGTLNALPEVDLHFRKCCKFCENADG